MFAAELKEIYSAERQLSRALPRLAKKVKSQQLRAMLEERVEQGVGLIEEIDAALEEMQVSKGRQKNVAAEGLIEDMTHHLEDIEDPDMIEAQMLASVQKVEHYCIAAWGTAAALGRLLGQDRVVATMERVLGEGKEFDERMTELAEEEINPRMMEKGEERGSGEENGRSSQQSRRPKAPAH